MQGHWADAGFEPSALHNPEACSSPQLFNFGVSHMKNISQSFKTFWADEEGATAIEYGLMASLIAAVLVASVGLIGTNLKSMFEYIAGKITTPSA